MRACTVKTWRIITNSCENGYHCGMSNCHICREQYKTFWVARISVLSGIKNQESGNNLRLSCRNSRNWKSSVTYLKIVSKYFEYWRGGQRGSTPALVFSSRTFIYLRRWQSRGGGRVFTAVCLSVCRTISNKTMQLGSPNLTYKCTTMNPGTYSFWGQEHHRSRLGVMKNIVGVGRSTPVSAGFFWLLY